MAYDANLILAALTTVATSTTTNSTGLSLRQPTTSTTINAGGTPRRSLKARVRVTANTGTASTADFSVQHSDDNSNWAALASPIGLPGQSTVTASSSQMVNAAGAQTIFIPFETDKAWVRLQLVTTGTNVSIIYAAEVGLARP